jgi:hypothetical protein
MEPKEVFTASVDPEHGEYYIKFYDCPTEKYKCQEGRKAALISMTVQ